MGRIKTRFVKASGTKIYEKVKGELTEDFEKNKAIVAKYAQIPAKRLRNSIVGYVTRLFKRDAKEEQ
jgi:small subunit ribosomal protein S17e